MSTLKADTIQSTSGGAATLTSQSAAKAWFDKSADGSSLLASLNISSLDDDGTGDYGLHYTSSFSSANYAISLGNDDNTSNGNILCDVTNGTRAAGSVDMEVYIQNHANTDTDPNYVSNALHGDLA